MLLYFSIFKQRLISFIISVFLCQTHSACEHYMCVSVKQDTQRGMHARTQWEMIHKQKVDGKDMSTLLSMSPTSPVHDPFSSSFPYSALRWMTNLTLASWETLSSKSLIKPLYSLLLLSPAMIRYGDCCTKYTTQLYALLHPNTLVAQGWIHQYSAPYFLNMYFQFIHRKSPKYIESSLQNI